jgi:rare lipoprotein A (peptidoglycan hydrolase)
MRLAVSDPAVLYFSGMHMRPRSIFLVLTSVFTVFAVARLVPRFRQDAEVGQVLAAETGPLADPSGEPTDRTPETYQAGLSARTPQEALRQLGVVVSPQDKVYAFPDLSYGLGGTIRVYRAQQVLIKDAGNDQLVRTWAHTVTELAKEQNLDLADQDRTDPPGDAAVPTDGKSFQVTITRVAESQLKEQESIDFTTQYTDDPTMEKGTQAVDQAGSNGLREYTYLVHRENGAETWRHLLSNTVLKAPVVKKVRKGTHVTEYGTGGASWYAGVGTLTAAHRTLPIGTMVRVVNTANGKSVVVRIADRGPFVSGRIVDLSQDAFAQIASIGAGVVQVRIEQP